MEKEVKSNPDSSYNLKKKKLKNDFEQRQKAAMRRIDKANPTIGNAGGNNPRIGSFNNRGRTIWSRKFFNRGGAQSIGIEIPTNQTHLLHRKEFNLCLNKKESILSLR